MPGKDPSHWLHRLSADEWLRAAANELGRARDAFAHRQRRAGVAGARRAAGMAWNAVLVGAEDERFGRSYMDHLQALATATELPPPLQRAAQDLLTAPLALDVIPLGAADLAPVVAAEAVLDYVRVRLAAS